MNLSLTCKCCEKMITSKFLKLWKSSLLTMNFKITGLLWNAKIYHLEQRQLWLFGLLSTNGRDSLNEV